VILKLISINSEAKTTDNMADNKEKDIIHYGHFPNGERIPDKKIFKVGDMEYRQNVCRGSYEIPYTRTMRISKITKCFVFWIELDTNCWNNSHKVLRKKKHFYEYKNCEYFEDNFCGTRFYADGTFGGF